MLTNENGRKTKRLSREILGLLLITAVIALFFWGFLYLTANSISETYFTERNLQPSEGQWLTLRAWIRSVSLLSTVILFLVLFLFLLGQKLAYLREIIQGVDALRTHRLEDTIPLREANELTELAEHINFLSETERRLRQQEMALQAERERMIRDLSHDIRTPLTAILSYSDYMSRKDGYTDAELREYFSLVRKKAAQMKDMTDRLLEGSKRNVEPVENGRLLMEQLAGEWEEILEDSFSCEISMENCTDFRAEWDMQEILRIFDNLSSNVEKYADSGHPVLLQMDRGVDTLRILQKNAVRQTAQKIESNPYMPKDKTRYLMGVGTPSNIIEGVARGVDFFDCVMPARNARHAKLFTWEGAINLKNAKYERDMQPIDPACDCPVCRRYSRAYIRHLFVAEEMLAMRLSVMHNLYFYNKLMERIRQALDEGRFEEFRRTYSERLDRRI